MPNKMLIDASHPEETRVVVVHGNRIEEFDFESQDKKQLKGNIYLARVTRVEPSLQAAFVEYGGNRHGFLAFSEIHPDYYQIPVADRQALLRAEAEAAEEENDEDGEGEDRHDRNRGRRRRRGGKNRDRGGEARAAAESADDGFGAGDDNGDDDESAAAGQDVGAAEAEASEISPDAVLDDATNISMAATADAHVVSEEISKSSLTENDRGGVLEDVSTSNGDEHEVESVGAEDALEEVRNRRKPVRRHYKIQEVIKRRQILLVQVVKEERGNKGAALTTYLSLAGRYSVLMPNTARGGGISRKITNVQDRKRLKEVVQDLDVPQGMGVILRTAGESRTKAEIKRDYEYLMRLWETVRTLTLQSTAPALVYEEGSLIKRSVRDLYNKDIDEVLVSGEDGYREAKDFMRMLMPSHAKVVQPYRDTTPIFVRNGIEAQLDRMLQPQVTLKSGGYIIINQTEALVAIDVNSGRSTKEHSIEETALHTNLEAAEEVARQLRLRDLAGLIVIDFIDMEENRNNRAVEKRLKDCLKNDRARIQVGRISHFGLMEMSRQRIRASVLESTMKPCPHCGGTGHVRSESSVALLVVRAIEEFLIKDSRNHISVRTPTSTALYVLNHKRSTLAELEARFGLTITIEMDDTVGAQHYAIFRGAVAEKPVGGPIPLLAPTYDEPEDEIVEEEEEEVDETAAEERPAQPAQRAETGEQRDRKRRKRRRRRGGKDRDRDAAMPAEGAPTEGVAGVEADDQHRADEGEVAEPVAAADEGGEDVDRKKRRRGKRGGKRNRRDEEGMELPESAAPAEAASAEALAAQVVEDAPVVAAPLGEEMAPAGEEPKKAPRRAARPKKVKAEEIAEQVEQPAVEPEPVAAQPEEKPKKPRASRRKVAEPALETPAAEVPQPPARASKAPAVKLVSSTPEGETAESTEEKPKKAGWWQRKSFF
ncbi:MAG TPA: Rne/Rng family ribonuclease [Pseudaminobacter sp.]|nr:Rne/Rng family ribonuclease [Pseudaminobacter sp.]